MDVVFLASRHDCEKLGCGERCAGTFHGKLQMKLEATLYCPAYRFVKRQVM
jgi:hypothetical protein